MHGECDIYGVHTMKNDEKLKLKVVTLKKGSWYGDYQILLNVKSSWILEATRAPKHTHLPVNMIQVFLLSANRFRKYIDYYPEFRRWLLVRSNIRRAYWIKVYEENRHVFLLQDKIRKK